MYDRDYKGKTLEFEASGGLRNSALVMQDRQTDTYWSIMDGKAIAGELEGTELVELPVSEKVPWKDWVAKHPDTLVLSVNGREDLSAAYEQYYTDPRGFRGSRAEDDRLDTKEPIYAFRRGATPYAIPQKELEKGEVYRLDDGAQVFLYRPKNASMFHGTRAFVSQEGFEKRGDHWLEKFTGARFDPSTGSFVGGEVEPLSGFDTFWYTWSLNNPETKLLDNSP